MDYLSFEVKKEEKGHTLHPKDPKAPLEFMSTRTRVRIPSRLGTKRKHAEFAGGRKGVSGGVCLKGPSIDNFFDRRCVYYGSYDEYGRIADG